MRHTASNGFDSWQAVDARDVRRRESTVSPRLRSGVVAIAAAVVPLALLSGCSVYTWDERAHTPTEAEIVGVWEAEAPDGSRASYTFAADGTWTARGVPAVDDEACEVDWASISDPSGTWMTRSSEDGQAPGVTIDEDRHLGNRLLALDDDGVLRLFTTICDPDRGIRLYWDKSS